MLRIFLFVSGTVALVLISGLIFFNLAGRNAATYVGDFRPDIMQIEDGNYEGSYYSFSKKIGASVSFEIKEGRLQNYHFDQLYGTIGYGAPENVRQQIDRNGNLDFEAVSGATVTSNLARAAIRNALEKGPLDKKGK